MESHRTSNVLVGKPLEHAATLLVLATVWLAWLVFVVLALSSCSSTTEPTNDGIMRITYNPPSDNVIMLLDETKLFTVNLVNAPGAVVTFCRGESTLGTGTEYLYEGNQVGSDSLCASVALPDTIYHKEWQIWVDAENAALPPIVPDLGVDHGLEPAAIVVSWTQPAASQIPRPLRYYHVAISYMAEITVSNWDAATIVDIVEHDEGPVIGYVQTYTAAQNAAIVPGQEAWLAVRAEDSAGLFSPVGDNLNIRITEPYNIEGFVRDDSGQPLHGVIVDYGCDTCKTATDLSGWFELGPFRNIDNYSLTTLTLNENSAPDIIDAYYDFQTEPIDSDTVFPLDIVLLGRRGLATECSSPIYGGDFLTYFMYITRTNQTFLGRPNQDLLKWNDYPLNVYINEAYNTAQTIPMDSLAVEALAIWNGKMGVDYLVQVDNLAEADIEIIYTTDLFQLHGVAEIENDGSIFKINEAIPNKMNVKIWQELNDRVYILEVTLHELGHALCMGSHSFCSSDVHLMATSPAGIVDAYWPELPIGDDEAAAVRAIRYLPQAVPMENYIVD